ncbi:hypothetical protein LTR08_005307 [Meristemomyces frigidus]|nr:hypothetical protein LTR08_005307 [Meristemomyces frigidus]
MDASQTVATWVGTLFTAVGLGSLIAQSSTITNQLDPFYSFRNLEHLGLWADRQEKPKWYHLNKQPPVGPVITASVTNGFCGGNVVRLTRKPTAEVGKVGWTALLSVLHPAPGPPKAPVPNGVLEEKLAPTIDSAERGIAGRTPSQSFVGWNALHRQPLHKHGESACLAIDRRTFIALLSIQNGRVIFNYSGPAGLRASYPAYNGIWYIEWPIGGPAIARFSHYVTEGKECYPAFVSVRVDKCINMLAGIVETGTSKIAFPGRKGSGEWVLEFEARGYDGAHGSRLLYNILGGKSHEVAKLFQRRAANDIGETVYVAKLAVPSVDDNNRKAILYIRARESEILQESLDCLPWSSINWSLHRGMKDILVAYGKATMDFYRNALALVLKDRVKECSQMLIKRGWDPAFVWESMPDMAYNAVMAGAGNSGNAVRVLTDAALQSWTKGEEDLDRTCFWEAHYRTPGENKEADVGVLDEDAVIALTKYVVLESSQELDYQMYHELPMEMLMA